MNDAPITGLEWRHHRCEKCDAALPFMYAIWEVFTIATAFLLVGFLGGYLLWR